MAPTSQTYGAEISVRWTSLETYTGFHEPVNDLAMALYHGYFPFPWATYRASQKSRMLADRVVQHPWVLAQATEAKAGERTEISAPYVCDVGAIISSAP